MLSLIGTKMRTTTTLITLILGVSRCCPVAAAFSFPRMMSRSRSHTTTTPALASSSSSSTMRGMARLDSSNAADPYSFSEKRELEARLDKIERGAASTLGSFYERRFSGFSVKPGSYTSGSSANRLSITSTCYALQAVMAGNCDTYDLLRLYLTEKSSQETYSPILVKPILEALLRSEWREDDLFQVPLLLSTLLQADSKLQVLLSPPSNYEQVTLLIRRLVEIVLKARPLRRVGLEGQGYSDYILYQCAQAYAALQESTEVPGLRARPPTEPENENDGDASSGPSNKSAAAEEISYGIGGLPLSALPDGAAQSLTLALNRCAEVSTNQLYRQLALHAAGDTTEFDVMRLAYSLLTYLSSTASLKGTAGLELVPGQGPLPGSRIGPANPKLVRAALRVFFDEQNEAVGLWDKGQPIYKSFRKQGRNLGNAFVFSLDTVGSLLEAIPCEEFRPYLPHLERTLAWVEDHQTVEFIPDYCDVESGQCFGKPLRGWASPHLSPDTSPLAWSTAQVLTCVSRMRRRIRELMDRDVLQRFRGVSFSEEGPVDTYWDRLLDSDLGDCDGFGRCRTLKDVLQERVIQPFRFSVESPSFGAAYSSILFGPPGTAKTTICESLARKMGWEFVVIDTSIFLADGLMNVAARIRYVFERLEVLDRCVILFDEIEEFCLDRETPGIGMESRMLTTAMLTAINDLRRAKRSVFFLATNRLRAFDSAITRPGRFDMQLFVGTPNLESRCIMFRQQLSKASIDEPSKEAAIVDYRSFLSSVWEETAMFMNYLEGVQFARACADIVLTGGELTHDAMTRILETQAAVMTVRGTVKDEFIASMGLSRL